MSTKDNRTGAFDDVLDPRMKGSASKGVSLKRKFRLSQLEMPLSTLDAIGIDIEWRDFNPEDTFEYPTTVTMDDGTKVHLHQDVREKQDVEDSFGDFGAAEDAVSDVIWTIVNLTDGTVTLTVVGDWGKKRNVPFEDFTADYEPITVSTSTGKVPRFGY